MNETINEMRLLFEDFCHEAEAFIARQKQYAKDWEEMRDIIKEADRNWTQVNNDINTLRHG